MFQNHTSRSLKNRHQEVPKPDANKTNPSDTEYQSITLQEQIDLEYISEKDIQFIILTSRNGKRYKENAKNSFVCFITSHGDYVSSAFGIKAFQYLTKIDAFRDLYNGFFPTEIYCADLYYNYNNTRTDLINTLTGKTKVEYLDLTDEDIQYIDETTNFYDITREQAMERFLTGNIVGNVLTDDEIEELEQFAG